MSEIRVRIAPSPTGNLHVGTARTALFNYLFARHHGGTYVLRVEDTDLERSEAQYEQNIFDGLHGLGLTWDEGPDVGGPYGPYRQSERLAIYREWADKLLEKGLAYWSYETEEELDALREQATAEKRPFIFRGKRLSPEEEAALKADPDRKPSLRLRIPLDRGDIIVKDLIRGDVAFDATLIGDFVLMKNNGTPSYNFAVVVDDILMKMTHIIRGEDHISNTPKQILLYEAFGAPVPAFAHVGMILAPDRTKLSKRHGATAVAEFVQRGYLPEAFVNFLSLLGWSAPDAEEVMSVEDIIRKFSVERISHSGAIFDIEKLNWMNGVYIRAMALDELLKRARPYMTQGQDLSVYDDERLTMILEAVREPLTTLSDLPEAIAYFFGDRVDFEGDVLETVLKTDESRQVLAAFAGGFLPEADFSSPEAIGAAVKQFANGLKPLKMKTIMWAIRGAVTGRVHGADLSKTLYILGKERIARRVAHAQSLIGPTVGV
jgi:glutamyl-tRNA synthetase